MGISRKYWKGMEELQQTPAFLQSKEQEFVGQDLDQFLSDDKLAESSTARRDFLKFLGFSVAAATVAACEAPVTKSVPYVIKPENITPGLPTWYASTYYDGVSYASILIKTREGRPIFIKGNKEQGFSKGAVNPQIVASVLPLYDAERLQKPMANGKDASWSKVDSDIKMKLASIKASGKKIVVLSNTVISPSLNAAIATLKGADYANFEHIQYDAVSYAGIRQANLASFGSAFIPDYDFSKAKTIVSIGADFMGTWLLANEYTSQYKTKRKPEGEWMSRHFQFESIMSLSGSNADYRGMIKPSEQGAVVAYILGKMGISTGVIVNLNKETYDIADLAFEALKSSGRESIVVAGSNDKAVQILVNKLNAALGTYGSTIDTNNGINLYLSEDGKVSKLVSDIISGNGPAALFLLDVNPAYTLSNGAAFAKALKNIDLTVALSSYADETASAVKYVAATNNALESWMDYMPKRNHVAIAQPAIRPLWDTSNAIESFLVWSGMANRSGKDSTVAYDYIIKTWTALGAISGAEGSQELFTSFNTVVHNSCKTITLENTGILLFNEASLSGIAAMLPQGKGTEFVLYQKAGIGTGIQASNPWLQELPDPISKVTWDNYITMSPSEAASGGYATKYDQETPANLATVKVNGKSFQLPVYASPGQAAGTIGIALGYGRGANNEKIGKSAYRTGNYGGYTEGEKGEESRVAIGKNAFLFVGNENGTMAYDGSVSISKAEGTHAIAATQIHHTVMARESIVRETTLDIFKKNDTPELSGAFNHKHEIAYINEEGHHEKAPLEKFDLWDAHPVENIGHRWGMTIDLSSCIGCGSCLIACQSENNVPVVGKDEVRRGREMHWLRLDRYYASDEEATVGLRKDKDTFSFDKAEIAAVNPKVIHMPMLCHHCNHAPCETVCPVAATTHSNEGLNQMTYNRCIGTRYCANNCPYKVRRFNWFNYPSYKKFTEVNPAQDDFGRMVLNPDVTVRTRGVMEKCSFCVQRIQGGKLNAKSEGRPVKDGDVTTACADVCPTDAITVGDWNDTTSIVRKSSESRRSYQALEEVGVKPNIWYKVKVRNEKNMLLEKLQVAHTETAHHGGGHEEKKSH
jgi:MoCo/4Fe-4S cofactor protein with predicted Tat translocation signal